MRKTVCILVAALVVFACACGDEGINNGQYASELNGAVGATNAETRISGQYMLEISFGDGAVLYYALGNIAWDRAEQVATAAFDQTYLGMSDRVQNFFESGRMTSISKGESLETEREPSELFSKFPYFTLPEYYDGCGNIKQGSNTSGTTYSFTYTDTKTLCDNIVGGDIYELASVIKKPQPEKTVYGDAECIYTVSDGRVVSCRYEFDIKLFDTPAYIPGDYSVPESEYTLDLHVTAKVTYGKFGDEVILLEPEE